MNFFKAMFSGLLVFFALNAYALDLGVEGAIEASALKLSFDIKTNTGIVVGRVCDNCKKLTVDITPKTRAYHGLEAVALAEVKSRLGREALVIFDKETMEVHEIRW